MVKTLKMGNKMRTLDLGDGERVSGSMGDFQYRYEPGGLGRVRVWRTSWFSDQFEVLTHVEFEQFKEWASRFNFQVIKAEDD